ncbi:MAG: hypothetical protein AB1921_05365 [Thermodesulfobacteriota bacterium]
MRIRVWAVLGIVALTAGCAGSAHTVKPEGKDVCLYLRAPKAASVELFSSASDYAPVSAMKNGDGLWEVRMPAGRPFDYFYLVDGEPFTPPCALSRPDGFGGRTCIYAPAP